jgi:ABC-2 type transport system ATP-binding protein
LDPVNVDLVRGIICELYAKGTSVILCAHEMHLVETLCDRIALINKGTIVLNGELEAIKRQFAPNALEISPSAEVGGYAEVVSAQTRVGPNGRPASTLISLRADVSPRQFLKCLIEDGHPIERFEVASIGLDEIFVRVVKGQEVSA